MSTDASVRAGVVVDARFHLEAPLDDWGVGESWMARDATTGARVALKLLPPLAPSDHASRARFEELARALERHRHRAVAATLHHGVWQGRPYLVQAHMPGVSLARGLALADTGRHLLAPRVLANVLDRACEAMSEAHAAARPLLHGRVMPGSIIAAMVTGRFEVRVLDFGLAPIFGDRLKVARSSEFVAPALEDDPANVTVADDVFALGAIVMESVTERRAPGGLQGSFGNLSAVAKRRADLPAALMAIAGRATRLDATQRYPDVASLREALASAWSPDARPVADVVAAAPSAVAGVAADMDPAAYSSWVRFADAPDDVPAPIVAVAPPVAPPPIAAPPPPLATHLAQTLVARAPAAAPSDLAATVPLRDAVAAAPSGLDATVVRLPPPAPYAPPPAPYAPPPALYAPPPAQYAPPVVYGAAPAPPFAPAPPQGMSRGARVALAIAALVAVAAVVVIVVWVL